MAHFRLERRVTEDVPIDRFVLAGLGIMLEKVSPDAPSCLSPGVMNGVSDDCLPTAGNRGSKLYGSGIRFSMFH